MFHFCHLTIVAATESSTAFNFALITFCGNKANKCVPFQPNDQSNGSSVKQARKKKQQTNEQDGRTVNGVLLLKEGKF